MTLFNSLLHLYKKNGATTKPTEDFCTECLAGILRNNLELTEDFARNVLHIEAESTFKVSTQRTFYSKILNEQGRVDLVFESQDVLCFIEMKVHSFEGNGQLNKYAQILNEQPNTVTTYLRYCTLYNEEKENYDNFEQFQWREIAKFLNMRSNKNHLIHEFHKFLKENNMAGNERFNHEDLVGLKVYNNIATKAEGVFSSIKKSLERFGSMSGGINSSAQITKHNRLAVFSTGILGDNWSEALVSFDFEGMRYTDEPVVAVQIYVSVKNSSYKKFVEQAVAHYQGKMNENKAIFSKSDEGHGAHIRYEKPLATFFSKEEQLRSIEDWIEAKLDKLMEFKNEHPDLDWNF